MKIYGSTIKMISRHEGSASCIVRVKAFRGLEASDVGASEGEDLYINIKGNYARPFKPGENIVAVGELEDHDVYGAQFKAKSMYSTALVRRRPMGDLLSSGVIYAIGKEAAKRLFAEYGESVLVAAEKDFDDFVRAGQINVRNKLMFMQQVQHAKDIKVSYDFLRNTGLDPRQSLTAIEVMGANEARDRVAVNPYSLLGVSRIGMKSVDRVALNIGIPAQSSERAHMALIAICNRERELGHLSHPKKYIEKRLAAMIGCDAARAEHLVKQHVQSGFFKIQAINNSAYLVRSFDYDLEHNSALEIQRLNVNSNSLPVAYGQLGPAFLCDEQREAIKAALEEQLSVITGGPGVGKTTVVNSILEEFAMRMPGQRVQMVAPTGKAARRMAEATGVEAVTIHTLLGYTGDSYQRGKNNLLDVDILIIDEASMVDAKLCKALLEAVPAHAKVIFVGDKDQLPSVDAGNVLGDLIDSGRVRVTRLTQVQRQAADSQIVKVAHNVIAGRMPHFADIGKDFHWVNETTDEGIVAAIRNMLTNGELLSHNLSLNDVQILSPCKVGDAGTNNLNKQLARIFNPRSQGDDYLVFNKEKFFVGDRVMQTKNEKKYDISNGDVGVIRSIDHARNLVHVDFDEKLVELPFGAFNDIVLSYATTVHKSQGSEYKAVIIPISGQSAHEYMMTANLIYTAITRGKQQVYMVGDPKVLEKALQKPKQERRTMLGHWLRKYLPPLAPKRQPKPALNYSSVAP